MRVVVTDDDADRLRRFSVSTVEQVAFRMHRIQDPALNRFQTISGIR